MEMIWPEHWPMLPPSRLEERNEKYMTYCDMLMVALTAHPSRCYNLPHKKHNFATDRHNTKCPFCDKTFGDPWYVRDLKNHITALEVLP